MELQSTPEVSQRRLAKRLGISLGATNLLLRNMMRKGYVRITRAHWKRWLYAVTPAGFYRKAQLTLEYIHRFLGQYQRIRQTLRGELASLGLNAESRVAIYGTGEFAEIVYLALREMTIEEIDVFDAETAAGTRFLSMPVQDIAVLRPEEYDRVVVAFLNQEEKVRSDLEGRGVAVDKIVSFFEGAGARHG